MTEDNGTRRAKHAAGDDPIEESVKDADTAVVTMTDDEPPISRAVIDTSAVADEDGSSDADEADDADDGKGAPWAMATKLRNAAATVLSPARSNDSCRQSNAKTGSSCTDDSQRMAQTRKRSAPVRSQTFRPSQLLSSSRETDPAGGNASNVMSNHPFKCE